MKKTSDNIELTKEDFSFVCPLNTDDMNSIDGGYFCNKCEKKVHDVTDFSENELNSLKNKNSNLCVTVKKVAMVSLVLGLAGCTPKPLTGKIVSNPDCEANVKNPKYNNRLTPFPVVDKNQTINIDRVEEPQIAGGMPVSPMLLGEIEPIKK